MFHGNKKPAEAGYDCQYIDKGYTAFRRLQPSIPNAEPSSQTAAGIGTAAT